MQNFLHLNQNSFEHIYTAKYYGCGAGGWRFKEKIASKLTNCLKSFKFACRVSNFINVSDDSYFRI